MNNSEYLKDIALSLKNIEIQMNEFNEIFCKLLSAGYYGDNAFNVKIIDKDEE